MFKKEQLDLLKQFVLTCKANPSILHTPDLKFFKDWLVCLGANIPASTEESKPKSTPASAPTVDDDSSDDEAEDMAGVEEVDEEKPKVESESDDEVHESDLDIEELDNLIKDEEGGELEMGDDSIEVTEEMMDESNSKRSEAISFLGEGNFEGAISSFTEAIKKNPQSANMYAKRASVLIKAKRPTAALRDCEKALTINKDSAQPYKWRGRAYRLLGKYVEAYHDFQTACRLDCDENSIEWKKEVEPNAKKIMDHTRKYERLREERDRNRKIKEAKRRKAAAEREYERATKEQSSGGFPGGFPGMGGMPGGMPGGMGGMPGGMGGMPGAGGMPGGMPGAGGAAGGMPGGMPGAGGAA